jgi:hypothetical protein
LANVHKCVTNEYPSDYQVGKVYRLRSAVVVERGGTSSPVSPYWVDDSEWDTDRAERTRKEIRQNQGGWRRDTRTILEAGTRLRVEQLWLYSNIELGVILNAYARVLEGPLQGKLIDIHSISLTQSEGPKYRPRCDVNPKKLELVPE